MPSQLLRGSAAEATTHLSLALNGTVPGNPIYSSYTAEFTRVGEFALANSFAAAYSNDTNAALATRVLSNLGVTAATIGAASYTTLEAAVVTAFASFPTARGQVALNLARLLTGLESDATYGAAATTWNNNAATAFTYSSNEANRTATTLAVLNAPVDRTLTLTTGVDTTLVGGAGNDTYSAVVTSTAGSATLTSGDQLNGGAGTDTLQITSTAAATLGAGVTSTSVENVTAIATGGALTLALDGFSGVANVTSNGSTADVLITGLAAIPVVNVTATSSNVTVTPATAAVSGLNDSATINLTGASTTASSTVTVNGVENITINSNGTSGSAAASGAITQTTIAGDGLLKSVTLSGTGTSKLAVSLSGATAGTAGTTGTVTGSAGADDIQISLPAGGSAANKLSADLGAGDDTVRLSSMDAAQTITGGAGTDTLVVSGAGPFAAAATANVTGFEKVVLTGTASVALATSDLTYTAAAGGTYTNLAAGATVNLNAGGTLTLANTALTGTTDAVTVNVGTATTAGTTGATVNAGTHDVVTVNALTRSDTLATASAIYTVSGTTLNSVTLNAPHAVALAGGGTALTNINASGVAGNFSSTATVSATSALTVTGGAGNDSITGGTLNDSLVGGAGNDTITGGVGQDNLTGGTGNDVFVIGVNATGAVVSSATAPDTITDFESGKDRIQIAQQNDRFAGNVANVQLGLAAMTGANQSFFVTSENTLYVVSGFANGAGVIANTDTIIKLTGVTALAVNGSDVSVGSQAGGNDTSLTAGTALVNLTASTNAAATAITVTGATAVTGATTTAFNDTVRATSAQLDDSTNNNGGTVSTLTGGNGTDTLIISGGGTLAAYDLASVTQFEQFTLAETTVSGGTTANHSVTLSALNVATGATFTVSASGVSTVPVTVSGAAVADTTSSLIIIGGSFATAAGDVLTGGNGNDSISGGAGNDSIIGGARNDTLIGGNGDDTIVAAGTDSIDGGAGNDVVQVGAALGASSTDLASIELGAGVNRINFTATASTANATIAATGGVYDILIDDGFTATMTPAQFSGAFLVNGVAGGGAENITFSASGTVNASAATNITGITLSGVSGTSTTGSNTLTVGSGTTSVVGAAGNDTINVASGAVAEALLEGTITGNAGTADTVNVTGNTNNSTGANDITLAATVTGVEVINFAHTTGTIELTTNDANVAAAGTLTVNATGLAAGTLLFNGSAETNGSFVVNAGSSVAGSTGADTLTGGAGNDVFNAGNGANVFTGNAGADSITGGTGVDTAYGDNGGTKRVETYTMANNPTAGDTVSATIFGFTSTGTTTQANTANAATVLAAAINANTNLSGLVSAAVTGGGSVVTVTYLVDGNTAGAAGQNSGTLTNTLAQTTAGTAGTVGADTIIGGAGADLIVGGGGNDVLTGDAGADRFFFLKAQSVLGSIATITDYRSATGNNAGAADTIVLGDVTTAAGTVATVQDFSSQASLGAALNAAANGNTVNNGLVVFMYGGDTYVLVETTGANTPTFVTTDFLVKITGTPFTTSTAIAGLGIDGI